MELTASNVIKSLSEIAPYIEADGGFVADGLDEGSFVDKDGDLWHTDEYGDRSYMWDYM